MPWACWAIFRDRKSAGGAFSRLAIAYPEHFQEIAEQSLTMPSLRAPKPNFTCDAEAIIQAIHLAEKRHVSNLHDNRTRIGALCHRFVAEIVDLRLGCQLETREKGRPQIQKAPVAIDARWFGRRGRGLDVGLWAALSSERPRSPTLPFALLAGAANAGSRSGAIMTEAVTTRRKEARYGYGPPPDAYGCGQPHPPPSYWRLRIAAARLLRPRILRL